MFGAVADLRAVAVFFDYVLGFVILTRDIPLMMVQSLSILFFGINRKHPRRPGAVRRKESRIWIMTFVVYTLLMFYRETHWCSRVLRTRLSFTG